MRVTLIAMGFLAILFGCKTKPVVSDKLAFDFKPVFDTVDLEEVPIGDELITDFNVVGGK